MVKQRIDMMEVMLIGLTAPLRSTAGSDLQIKSVEKALRFFCVTVQVVVERA